MFLNTLGQMNREMYHVENEIDLHRQESRLDTMDTKGKVGDGSRFTSDLVLNQGVRAKTESLESSKLMVSMREEIKNLKSRLSFVIDKDKEISKMGDEKS